MNASLGARGFVPRALDRAAIEQVLPQRPPLLLVDRVVGVRESGSPGLAARLDITGAEPVFAGHFPGRPLWPGSYTVEGLAQTCALVGRFAGADPGDRRGAPASASSSGARVVEVAVVAAVKVKLTQPITPPATLEYVAELAADLGTLKRFSVEAWVGAHKVASGSIDVAMAREPFA